MSVLLRQAHGFEGVRVVPEELQKNDLALAYRVDARHLQVSVRTAPCAMPDEPHRNAIAKIDEFADELSGVSVPCVAELLQEVHDGVAAHLRPWLRPTFRVPHDPVWVEQLAPGVHVARVPQVEAGFHDLHVLLRHRPRSIAQVAQEEV